MKKLLIGTSLLLATLAATPSFAASRHVRMPAQPSHTSGYDAYAAAEDGITAKGPAIYSYGVYAGWDPDPNIRYQLRRDPGLLLN